MKKSEEYEIKIARLIEPILKQNDLKLYDVDFSKEGEDYYLRIFIEKNIANESVSINDCEIINRHLNKILDEDDFIENAYTLEVSSVGLTRTLKKDKEFELNKGKLVDLSFFKTFDDGKKQIQGILNDYDSENKELIIEYDNQCHRYKKSDISLIRLAINNERIKK